MKKLMAAAMFSGLMAGVPVFAADNPPPATQPAGAPHHFFLMHTDQGGGGLPPGAVGAVPMPGAPGEARVVQGWRMNGGGPDGNVTFRAFAPKLEKAAWMGLSTSHPPQVLLKQLKLKAGLVVDRVEPGSPAETAGLKSDDLIEKLDDQILINPAQLEGLVRMHNAGDSVALTVLHEGTQSTITVKLVEHEVLAMDDDGPQAIGVPAGVMQEGVMQAGGMQGMMPGAMQMQVLPGTPQAIGGMPLPEGAKVLMRSNGDNHMEMMTKGGNSLVPGFESDYVDDANELTVVHHDKERVLIIKDRAGKQLFEGPIDTAEQQAKIPKELLPSFNAMQKMSEMADKPGPEAMPAVPMPAPRP